VGKPSSLWIQQHMSRIWRSSPRLLIRGIFGGKIYRDILHPIYPHLTLFATIAPLQPTIAFNALVHHPSARAPSKPIPRPLSTGVTNSMSKKLRYVDVGQRPLLIPSRPDPHSLHHCRSASTLATPSFEASIMARKLTRMISKTCCKGPSMSVVRR